MLSSLGRLISRMMTTAVQAMDASCDWNNGGDGSNQYRFECYQTSRGCLAIEVDEYAECGGDSMHGDIPCPGCRTAEYNQWKLNSGFEIPLYVKSDETLNPINAYCDHCGRYSCANDCGQN